MEGMKQLDKKAKKKLKMYDDAYDLDDKHAKNCVANDFTIDTNRIPVNDKVSKSEPKLVS
jgi:hypothetical protein